MTEQTRRDELIALAERVEQATGPDREIDADIRLAVLGDRPFGHSGPPNRPVPSTLSAYVEAFRELLTADDAIPDDVVPRYSASLDAAMQLVSEEWLWAVESYPDHAEAVLRLPYDDGEEIRAATPALALCAAALRAHANKENDDAN